MRSGPACEAAWKESAVFLGTVTDLRVDDAPKDNHDFAHLMYRTRATFEVQEAFLGMEGLGQQLEIRTGSGGGDCGYRFQLGASYLVYVFKTKDGLLTTSICSRTAPSERAQEDLIYLRSLAKGLRPAYISGAVIDGEALQNRTQEGIAGATVTLTGEARNIKAITGDEGKFRFDNLPPGKYNVAVTKDGYALRYPPGELELHAGGCALVSPRLQVDRRIAGKVTGADGLPAAGVPIEIVPMKPTAQNTLPTAVDGAVTGPDGSYEIRNVPAGAYYLGVSLSRPPSRQSPYARYFYPGTEAASRAGIVVVKAGPGSETYNFAIPKAQHERTVEGFVRWPDGRPEANAKIVLEDPRWSWQAMSVVVASTDAKGHFSIPVFDGTVYRVHAWNVTRQAENAFAAAPVPVTPDTDVTKPLQLILSTKGDSILERPNKDLEHWRTGLGLP